MLKRKEWFFFNFFKFFVVIQLQLCAFYPHPSTPPKPPSLPHLYPPPWFCPCVLYSSSCNPFSSLSPPHSPMTIVRLFLTSMSLVIFCFIFSSIYYVPVKGEIIWYLSLTGRLVRPLWKTVWNFLRKLKMQLPFDPAIPLLGLYPKNPETPIQKNLCTPMFIAAQFTIAKYWQQPKCPSANEWIQKLWYIYTMEFYAAEGKKELIPFATAWMELESIMLRNDFLKWERRRHWKQSGMNNDMEKEMCLRSLGPVNTQYCSYWGCSGKTKTESIISNFVDLSESVN